MREILKPQFCWYFLNVLLWVILMEIKVSQVGCFQITGCWKSYSIFFDISFIVTLSKVLWRNHPFSAQISKSISICSILQKIKMFIFVILKWRSFDNKLVKGWKICPFWGLFFRNKKCWQIHFSWIKYFGNDFSFLIK